MFVEYYNPKGGIIMYFEDNFGKIWLPDEVDELMPYEIEELGIHVAE